MRGRSLFDASKHTTQPNRLRNYGVATIELAAALSVTLVMVALAISAYRTHSVRREVRASVEAVAPIQDLVIDTFERSGVPPSEAELPAFEIATLRHGYIEALAIEHGRIEIRFGLSADESLRGRSLSVSPFETMDGEVSWLCGTRSPGVGLYPLGLFGSALAPAQPRTTVDQRYLPLECR